MLDQNAMVEIALRGGAAGINLLIAGLILFSKASRMKRVLGALFAWSVAVYILLSGRADLEILGVFKTALIPFAVYTIVFFWWFALSLFDDAFKMTWWKWVPFAILAILHPPFSFAEIAPGRPFYMMIHQLLVVGLLVHILWIALHDRADDLVDPRRRFRLFFAFAIGAIGISIAVGESIIAVRGMAEGVTLIHAVALAAFTLFFGFWMLSADAALFGADNQRAGVASPALSANVNRVADADMAVFERLTVLMDEGVYRQEGLSVGILAQKVGVPEHQLRKLINGALGFRNFSTFLNARRIEDAKTILADPVQARRQVLQIGLELGYGSIGPFNRAFKEASGQTPSQFRKNSLNGG